MVIHRAISLSILLLAAIYQIGSSQEAKDMALSVPAWITRMEDGSAILQWMHDESATRYELSDLKYSPVVSASKFGEVDGQTDEFPLGPFPSGITRDFYIKKTSSSSAYNGIGLLQCGFELPPEHENGRCLIAVDKDLYNDIYVGVLTLAEDMDRDGWETTILEVPDTLSAPEIKTLVSEWYDEDYSRSQALFILGHLAVPYSGNVAYDGHPDHQDGGRICHPAVDA